MRTRRALATVRSGTAPPRPARVAAAALLAAALSTPGAASAQVRTCTLVQGGTLNQFDSPGIGVIAQYGGPVVFRCGGGVLIRARRATVLETRREVRLDGDVLYRDSVQELTTDFLQRRTADGLMLARGSVVMRDLSSGSEIRGAQMQRRDVAGQPTETRITGRPRATLYRESGGDAPEGALGSPAGDGIPIEVDADEIVLLGANIFRATGNTEFRRGADLQGTGDALEFDDATGALTIDGNAQIDGARFDLRGDRVDALTVEGEIREVAAFGNAVLEGDAMYLEAPSVMLFFERELLQSLEARGRAPRVGTAPPPVGEAGPGGPGDPAAAAAEDGTRRAGAAGADAGEGAGRAPLSAGRSGAGRAGDTGLVRPGGRAGLASPTRGQPGAEPIGVGVEERGGEDPGGADDPPLVFARAEGLEIRSDSLHVVSPDERLEMLTAVGRAHGVRRADSLAAAYLPAEFADEWVRGDTVVARFGPDTSSVDGADGRAADAPGDPGLTAGVEAERTLEELSAVGHGVPASALSHIAEDTPGEYTINYLIARRILMLVKGGEAREVQAEGTLRGVYLTPDGSPAAAPDVETVDGQDGEAAAEPPATEGGP